MDIRKEVTVEAPIAPGNAVIVRDQIADALAVATARIDGKPRFIDLANTPPAVGAVSFW